MRLVRSEPLSLARSRYSMLGRQRRSGFGMTIYNALMTLGVIVIVAIIVKGFWSARRVKAGEPPDNWPSTGGSHPGGD